MAVMRGKDWRTDFGIADRDPPYFFGEKATLDATSRPVPQAHTMRRAFDSMQLDGILLLQNSLMVYFKEVSKIQPQQMRSLQRRFWNHGLSPILVSIDPKDVYIYSGLTPPPDDQEDINHEHRLVQTLSRVAEAAELRHFVLSVESGEFFRRYAKSFDPRQRVDRRLLRHLQTTREKLAEVSSPLLDPQVLEALLCRVVFTCYLFDRQIVSEAYLRSMGISDASSLHNVLNRPSQAAKLLLYALFKRLSGDFNGDLFSDDLDAEAEHITGEHLEILNDFLQGADVNTGQRSFWPYDFSVIPIETISVIYQHFLKIGAPEGTKQSGAFYTPRFLAEVVLDMALEGFDSLLDKRFLDPACGSGIFLVGLFNRLAEEWRRYNAAARYDQRASGLMTILRDRLCGVDANPTACRIAAFSLYLALLDQLSPPDIQQLQSTGALLPRLVFTSGKDTFEHSGKTILCSDFFDSAAAIPEDFDLVVGNPPWVPTRETTALWETWCAERNLPIANRQMALGFIWKAAQHQQSGGRVCFVLPHGVLFNHQAKALEFQHAWVTRHTLDVVLNLADYQRFLFDEAESPALVIRYRREAPYDTRTCIEYLFPKTEWKVSQAEIITITPEDRAVIQLRELLSDLTKAQMPLVWKQKFWGTPRDQKLLDRLSELPTLAKCARQPRESEQKRWVVAQGFQPEQPGRQTEESKPRPWLSSELFLEARSRTIDLFVREADCSSIGDRFPWLSRLADLQEIFQAPHVLVTKGLRVAFADFDVVFRHAVRGIHGPAEDRHLLIFLAAYLRSPLARYFLFHTSSNWGISRAEVQVEELLRLPFPLPEQTRKSQRNHIIVDKVATYVSEAIQDTPRLLNDRDGIVNRTQQAVEPLIYEYFEIDEVEQFLIEDTNRIVIRSARPSRASDKVPTLRNSTDTSRAGYITVLCETLNDWASGGSYSVQGRVLTSVSSGVGVVVLERHKIGDKIQAGNSDTNEMLSILERLQKLFKKELGSVELLRGVKVFDGNNLYLVKPLSQRFWTKTAALNDADAIAATILSHITEKKP